MGLERGEPFGFAASFNVAYSCCELEDAFDVVHNLVKTPLEGCCDVYGHEESLSLDCDSVLPNPFNHSHVFPMCLQPSSSPEYYFDVPIDSPMICDAIVDLGYDNNVVDVLDGNVDKFVSLGYFSRYDALLIHIAYF